jgi:hypothetical protein
VSTPSILASKSGRGPLSYCKIGTELGGSNRRVSLTSLYCSVKSILCEGTCFNFVTVYISDSAGLFDLLCSSESLGSSHICHSVWCASGPSSVLSVNHFKFQWRNWCTDQSTFKLNWMVVFNFEVTDNLKNQIALHLLLDPVLPIYIWNLIINL